MTALLKNDALVAELNRHRGDLDLESFVASLLSLYYQTREEGGWVGEVTVRRREADAHDQGVVQGREEGYRDGERDGRLLGQQYAEMGHLIHALYDAAAPGFHTAEASGHDDRYQVVAKFQDLVEMQAYYSAWVHLMVFVRDARREGEAS